MVKFLSEVCYSQYIRATVTKLHIYMQLSDEWMYRGAANHILAYFPGLGTHIISFIFILNELKIKTRKTKVNI